uniref:Uncharacterized protein n=1 Tax=Podoviridae sp. ct53O25 TaxID=2826539 RepID=A0A8S5MBN9_9CAUD|nr:MAG TPA: hypothetical protein [Podoviridae sp. ct53O25]
MASFFNNLEKQYDCAQSAVYIDTELSIKKRERKRSYIRSYH